MKRCHFFACIPVLFALLLMPFNLHAQSSWIPGAGATVTYTVATGDHFYDPGGPGGCLGTGPCAGNYPNCNCRTLVTLCPATPGDRVEAEFLVFAMFNTASVFDYMRIYDNNTNTGTLLFSNYIGGTVDYGTNGTSPMFTVTATNASGCLTFDFWATSVVDRAGWDAIIRIISSVLEQRIGYVTAAQAGPQVVVEWSSVDHAQDISLFEVEVSTDGVSFSPVGTVQPGNQAPGEFFRFQDAYPATGDNHYRIRQVSSSGEVTYSSVVTTQFTQQVSPLTIGALVPSSEEDMLVVRFALDQAGTVQYHLLDALGREVGSGTPQGQAGPNELTLNVASLEAGVYFVVMQSAEGAQQSKRFLIP